MSNELITLGEAIEPPEVDQEKLTEIYNCVKSDSFDAAVFNSILVAAQSYLCAHEIDYEDIDLPFAEYIGDMH